MIWIVNSSELISITVLFSKKQQQHIVKISPGRNIPII